jgi:hypothetical protein
MMKCPDCNTTLSREDDEHLCSPYAQQICELTADRDKYRDACERLIGHYGDAEEWGEYIDCRGGSDGWMSVFSPTADNGADFARQVKAEIDNNAE